MLSCRRPPKTHSEPPRLLNRGLDRRVKNYKRRQRPALPDCQLTLDQLRKMRMYCKSIKEIPVRGILNYEEDRQTDSIVSYHMFQIRRQSHNIVNSKQLFPFAVTSIINLASKLIEFGQFHEIAIL